LSGWERQGYKKLDDVPEGDDKEDFRRILKQFGFKIQF
jgi:hypothetical protein